MSLALLIKTKSETRKTALDAAGAILNKASKENRDMTADERSEFDKRHADGDALLADIQRMQKQLEAEKTLDEERDDRRKAGREDRTADDEREPTEGERKANLEKRNQVLNKWMRFGTANMNQEERGILGRPVQHDPKEMRGLGITEAATAGNLVSPDTSFYGKIVMALKQFALDESMFTVITSDTGASLPIPTVDDTENTDTAHTEADAADPATDPEVSQKTLGAFSRTTGFIKVSNELLQDSSVDIEQFIGQIFGQRVGRQKKRLLTVGVGTTQPEGLVTGATLGVTAASASGITYAEYIRLIHSVDPDYRQSPTARLMFNDSTLLSLKLLVDENNRPLWNAGIAGREPDTFDGKQYVINQHMASIGAGNRSVVFGDMKSFYVRNVKALSIMRLAERFAEEGVVAFIGFTRYDSKVIDAGTGPIRYLVHPSSS